MKYVSFSESIVWDECCRRFPPSHTVRVIRLASRRLECLLVAKHFPQSSLVQQPYHLYHFSLICSSSMLEIMLHSSTVSVFVDQPVHWCLDTQHRHRIRYTDRPYGGKLSKDIDRISSLFY